MHDICCFQHRAYKGAVPPELSCKACCAIFLAEVKRKRQAGIYFDYKNWQGDRRKTNSLKSINKTFVDRRFHAD